MMSESCSPGPAIVAWSPDAVAQAAALLRAGQVVGYPTETAYGLGVDALSAVAVSRLTRLKGRASAHYFSILVADEAMLRAVVSHVPPRARALMARHWPGPLTLVLPAAAGLAPGLVNQAGGVGVRRSSDPVATELVATVGRPITATSANLAGAAPAHDARAAALEGVAMVLDDGPRRSPVSTVVQVLDDHLSLLRPGPIEVDGA